MSDNGEQKAPTYDQVSTGPVYAIIGHTNVQQTGTVYMIRGLTSLVSVVEKLPIIYK